MTLGPNVEGLRQGDVLPRRLAILAVCIPAVLRVTVLLLLLGRHEIEPWRLLPYSKRSDTATRCRVSVRADPLGVIACSLCNALFENRKTHSQITECEDKGNCRIHRVSHEYRKRAKRHFKIAAHKLD